MIRAEGPLQQDATMKIAFTTLACPDWTLDEIIDNAAAYGYDAIDFRGLLGQMGVYIRPELTDDADATKARLAAAGLAVSCFSSGARLVSAQAQDAAKSLAEVKAYAPLCRTFAAPFIRVFGGQVTGDRTQAIEAAAQTLDEMARLAGDATVLVETHDDWIDSSILRRVFEKVKASNVGVLWDLHHPWRMLGEPARTTWDNLGRWIRYTHVKDSRPTSDGTFEYCLPGEGDVPLAEMIALLADEGYDGYLTVEWEKKWHPEIADPSVALPAYADFLRSVR